MRAELYTIDCPDVGKLSVMARPRGGDWLSDEVQAWRDADVDVVVSLLTPAEEQELELVDEANLCERIGLIYVSYPISDRAVPLSVSDAKPVIDALTTSVSRGKHVAIHCRAGIGRSAMIAAAILVAMGETPEHAFSVIHEARGCEVPDTIEQRLWVELFSMAMQAPEQK